MYNVHTCSILIFLNVCTGSSYISMFCSSSRKYYHYRRTIGEHVSSETDMPLRRSTCLIGDPLENSTCLIGDRHAPSETDMPDRRLIKDQHACEVQSEFKHIHILIHLFLYIFCLFIYIGIM